MNGFSDSTSKATTRQRDRHRPRWLQRLTGGSAASLLISLVVHGGTVTALLVGSPWLQPPRQYQPPPRDPISIQVHFEKPAVRLVAPRPPELPKPDPLPVVPLVAMEPFEPPPVEEPLPTPTPAAPAPEPMVVEDPMPEPPAEEATVPDTAPATTPAPKELITAATESETSWPVAPPSPATPSPTPPAPPSPAPAVPPPQPAPKPAGSAKVGVKVLRWQDPTYPASCRRRGEQGLVRLEVEVRADGTVGRITVLQHADSLRLADAAIDAIKEATFAPATVDGKPIGALVIVPVRFQLK
jgi:protein TonB